MGRWRWIAWAALLGAGCAGRPHPTYSATFTDRSIRIESYVKSFRAAEPSLVQSLSGETRLCARIFPKPTSAELAASGALAYGGGNWLARGFVDPFLFSDREAALGRSRQALDGVALPPALRAELLDPRGGTTDVPELRRVRLEQEAFRRLLDAEDARLERERTLPKGAADLFRAVVLGWPLSPRAGTMHDLESMLAWRLQNVEQALTPGSLSEAERDDLRGVLAELAPRVAPLRHTAAAMAKLRTTLDAMWVTPYATEDEATMDHDLEVYVGSPLSFDALDGAFAAAARALGVQLDAGFSVLDERAAARVRARARSMLLAPPPCEARVPVRTPLDMAPPAERAWACSLIHALDDVRTDEDELAADLAWHDAIVVARWSVSTHGPVRAPDAALRLASLRAGESSADRARLFLLARARPMRAIAPGIAAVILAKSGVTHTRARARAWRAIGDAPMDMIAPLLGPKRE
jgi:hypothetical protein